MIELPKLLEQVGVGYISSYLPRKCGIASYTKDLTNALNLLNPSRLAKIVALDDQTSEELTYPHEVIARIRENEAEDYARAIKQINEVFDDIKVISLQHEYGIFGADDGRQVLSLVEGIKKPTVATLHTIVSDPSPSQKEILQSICRYATYVVPMLTRGAEILEKVYGVPAEKIQVIAHGVPNFPHFDSAEAKQEFGWSDRIVMSSINLLSEQKGIEFALEALPAIVKAVPNFLFLVVGQSHPAYLRSHGSRDPYREKLTARVRELGVGANVQFVDQYVSLKQLVKYITASDFYITPYLDPNQAASGALAYAIGAGRVCISTPYLYAEEMLADGRGILVPFRQPKSIAEAVIEVSSNPQKRNEYERNAYEIGRMMTWPNVAHHYFHLFQAAAHGSNH